MEAPLPTPLPPLQPSPINSPLQDFPQESWSLPDSWTLTLRSSEVPKPQRQGQSVCQGRVPTQGYFLLLWGGRQEKGPGQGRYQEGSQRAVTYPAYHCLALRQGWRRPATATFLCPSRPIEFDGKQEHRQEGQSSSRTLRRAPRAALPSGTWQLSAMHSRRAGGHAITGAPWTLLALGGWRLTIPAVS